MGGHSPAATRMPVKVEGTRKPKPGRKCDRSTAKRCIETLP